MKATLLFLTLCLCFSGWAQPSRANILKRRALLSSGLSQPVLISTTTNASTASGAGATMTTSAVSASGGNYMLIAICENASAIRSITSVTTGTGAQTATNIITASYVGATSGKLFLYGIVNPTTGDVVVTFNNTAFNATVITMLFNNVGGSGVTGSGTAGSDFSGSARTSTSDNLTTLSTDLAVDALAYNQANGNPTKGGSQTLIAEPTTPNNNAWLACSTQPGSAGTTTMGWTFTSQVVTWAGVVLNGK